MPIFGVKPNAAFVVILYDLNPPSSIEQDEILSEISKRVKLQARLIGTDKVSAENRAIKAIFDKYIEMICAMKLANGNFYFLGDHKTRVDTFGLFTVATMTGRVDYSY